MGLPLAGLPNNIPLRISPQTCPKPHPEPLCLTGEVFNWNASHLAHRTFFAARIGNPDQTCRGESTQIAPHVSQTPITKPQCCMESRPLVDNALTFFCNCLHTAHAFNYQEWNPCPTERSHSSGKQRTDYKTTLPAWFDLVRYNLAFQGTFCYKYFELIFIFAVMHKLY
jgi:hypothetical protein